MAGNPIRRVVIVGAGQAGVHLASSLRRLGYAGDVTLVSAESSLPYQRPPLSKAFLRDPDPAHLEFHDAAHYSTHGIRLLLDAPVTTVDRLNRTVSLCSGEVLPYDHLVLATGSRPRRITDLPHLRNVFHLHDRESALALGERLREGCSMLLVGGGFIGLEIATAAAELGCPVTVVEQMPSLLAHAVPPQVSEFLHDRHRTRGVQFRLGRSVVAFSVDRDRLTSVTTDDGAEVAADVVVVGVGSEPCTELAGRAGLNGIDADDRLRTADPDISAIGDCVRFPLSGRPVRLTSVQHAMDSALHVAKQLVGHDSPYRPVPWFWTDQAGVKVQMAGTPRAEHDRTEVVAGPSEDAFAVRHFLGERFVGGVTVGMPREHLAMRRELAAAPAPVS